MTEGRACLQGCHVGVIALSDPADQLLYNDPIVDYNLRYEMETPSLAIQQAVHFMHKASYTHVFIQLVRQMTPSIGCPPTCPRRVQGFHGVCLI